MIIIRIEALTDRVPSGVTRVLGIRILDIPSRYLGEVLHGAGYTLLRTETVVPSIETPARSAAQFAGSHRAHCRWRRCPN